MKRIIIVEDEVLIAQEISGTLEMLGYQVVAHVMNGDEALDVFAQTQADLVLLDINIKGTLNGIDLANILRDKYQIPFVFLTSFSDHYTLNQVKETMPYGYIVKPFNEDDLRSNIELAIFKFQSENHTLSLEAIAQKHNVKLSAREYQVLSGLLAGKKYKDIAVEQFISMNTVKAYQKKIYLKFNVNSKYELIEKLK